MTTTSKHIVEFLADNDFVTLRFHTVGGVDEGGNGEHPSTLTIMAEQMTSIAVNKFDNGVTLEFVGQLEFNAFRTAIRELSQTLDKAFGS